MKKSILGIAFLATVVLSQHVAAQDKISTPIASQDVHVAASSESSSQAQAINSSEAIDVSDEHSQESESLASNSETDRQEQAPTTPTVPTTPTAPTTPAAPTVPTTPAAPKNSTTAQMPQRILKAAVSVTTKAMYRLYNPNSGEHFYTASAGEAKNLILAGWSYEGVGWFAPEKSSTPVYRLYNPNAGDHHFTTLSSEKDMLTKVGWRYEGIGWYSDDAKTVKLFRAYNSNAKAGSHNYTKNASEQAVLIKAGWRDEGTAWFGSKIVPLDNQDAQLKQTYRPNTWYTIDGKKKHTDDNKKWQTGFQWISGQIYYFDGNGNMQANKTVTDRGNTYQLKADGTLTSGNATIEKAISAGMTKVGNSPYVLGGGRTPASIAANQFDCSSFTFWAYQQAGVSLGEQTVTTTWTQAKIGRAVSFASMKRGDIFMMANTNHVGLYLGGGYFIHSSPNAKFSTVYGGKAQPSVTVTGYSDYYGSYYGGVGVSRMSDIISRDPADGKHEYTYKSWEQIQNNVVRRIVQ